MFSVGDQPRQQRAGQAAAGDHEPAARCAARPERARRAGRADVHGARFKVEASGKRARIPLPSGYGGWPAKPDCPPPHPCPWKRAATMPRFKRSREGLLTKLLVAALAVALLAIPSAWGRSRSPARARARPGVPAEPGGRPPEPVADRPERRRLLGSERPAYHTSHADGPGRQRPPVRHLGEHRTARRVIPLTRRRTRSPTTGTTTSSSRPWRTTGSPRRRSTSSPSASGAPLRPTDLEPQGLRINQLGKRQLLRDDHSRSCFGSARAALTTPRTPKSSSTSTGTRSRTCRTSASAARQARSARASATTGPSPVSDHISPTPDAPCVADWDSVSYTSTAAAPPPADDTDLHYPADLKGEVHHDGQIWSRALWDIHQALGPDDGGHGHPPGLVRLPRDNDDRPRGTGNCSRGIVGPLRVSYGAQSQRGVPGPRNPLIHCKQWLDLLEDLGEVERGVSLAWAVGRSGADPGGGAERGLAARCHRARGRGKPAARGDARRGRRGSPRGRARLTRAARDAGARPRALRCSSGGFGRSASAGLDGCSADGDLAWCCFAAGSLAAELGLYDPQE